MAVMPIIPMLLLTVALRCRSDHINGYNTNNGNGASQFGQLLKPPPPPQLASIVPVPFHLGPEKNQRYNKDVGYQYQAPPPLPPPSEFKFPAPFYKQYNFNFVPQPQPFSTTPSPSMFQKVSEWLFPSQQTSYAESTLYNNNNNIAPIKKDCNPCNLVPWLPLIRYNIGAKNIHPNPLSTYGPPNPTAYADALNQAQKYAQPFNTQNFATKPPQLTPGIPHANYGPPTQKFNNGIAGTVSSTYGPPSATHTLDVYSPNPPSSTFSQPSTSYGIPNTPLTSNSNLQNSQLLSVHSQEPTKNIYNDLSSTYRPSPSSYATPSASYGPLIREYGTPYISNTYLPVTPQYDPGTLNKELPQQGDVELLENITPITELKVPKQNSPTIFKNSYGEPITNTHLFDISYPISATAAESSKIKTKVLPHDSKNSTTPNIAFALSNPAPFTLNRGRNIHTLQPVALPNLSVSPLPPIFNARPFRPERPQFATNSFHGSHTQQPVTNVHIQQSIPLTEYTHSVDYPATIIESPIIEIDAPTISNQTKGYRNIANSYVVDEIRDISSQASESVSATKPISDASFETTGLDYGNELYDSGIPVDLKQPSGIPSNHRPDFADLRGMNDEDLDKYRTENNLQNIDSPLLYLKPSAPHKNHGNFIIAKSSSPSPENDYEIYDDGPTTPGPFTPTLSSNWDESRNDYQEEISSSLRKKKYKPNIVQIIVPYTTGNEVQEGGNDFVEMARDWPSTPRDENQARKVPSNTDNTYIYSATETYTTETTTNSEESTSMATDNTETDQYHATGPLKDVYDVKEPPFDIIKLQHTIDDWTQQEYSNQFKSPQKTRSSESYAKKIPDNFFTTSAPLNYVTNSHHNNDFYDHEGSSSIQHSVTDNFNNETNAKTVKEYNAIERQKNANLTSKNDQTDEVIQRLHIYTAASSFRTTSTSTSTTTTPAPWGKIQTSISPLTKEKVYVVTSKPWRESRNISKEWYDIEPFQSMKIKSNVDTSSPINFPFKSPRFLSRPSFDFTSGGKIESDASYGYSNSWFQSINELETRKDRDGGSMQETEQQEVTSDFDEDADPNQ